MSGRQDHHLWNRATDVAPLALGLQLHIGERQDVSPPIPEFDEFRRCHS